MGSSTEESSQKQQKEMSQEQQSLSASKPPSIIWGPSAPVPLFMTFGQLLDHHAEVRPDKPAVISHVQGKTISFKGLRERSLQLARSLSADGIGKGDLVAISLGSRIEYFEVYECLESSIVESANLFNSQTFFACAYLGAALVLLNYAYTETEMIKLLKIIRMLPNHAFRTNY